MSAGAAARALVFAIDGRSRSVPLDAVAAVAAVPALRAVPGAPAALRGVGAARGRLWTVYDLAALLDRAAATGEGEPCLLLLAAPWERVALRVPGSVRIAAPCGPIDLPRLLARAGLQAASR